MKIINQPFFFKLALLCAFSTTIQTGAQAAPYPFVPYGLRYYQAKDYSSAAGYFKKAVDAEPNDPKAHYLYGLALMQMGKKNDALRQFYQSFHLNPASSYAGQIKALLQKNNYQSPDAVHATPYSKSASTTQAQATSGDQEDEPAVKQEEVDNIKRKLPRLNSYTQSGPTLSQFMQWPAVQQGSYIFGNARPALAEAENNASVAQQQYDLVKKQLDDFLPVFPNYGESTEEFKKRRGRLSKASQVLLEPYQEKLTECRNTLSDVTAIKNRAEAQINNTTLVYPYWGPMGAGMGSR